MQGRQAQKVFRILCACQGQQALPGQVGGFQGGCGRSYAIRLLHGAAFQNVVLGLRCGGVFRCGQGGVQTFQPTGRAVGVAFRLALQFMKQTFQRFAQGGQFCPALGQDRLGALQFGSGGQAGVHGGKSLAHGFRIEVRAQPQSLQAGGPGLPGGGQAFFSLLLRGGGPVLAVCGAPTFALGIVQGGFGLDALLPRGFSIAAGVQHLAYGAGQGCRVRRLRQKIRHGGHGAQACFLCAHIRFQRFQFCSGGGHPAKSQAGRLHLGEKGGCAFRGGHGAHMQGQ